MNFQAFIDGLTQAAAALKARANELLSGLPPIEQHQAAGEVSWGVRQIQSAINYLKESAETFEGRVKEIEAKVKQEVSEQLSAAVGTRIQEMLSNGEYLSKADAQAAANQAASNRETEVRTQFQTIASRRAELCAAKEGEKPILTETLSRYLTDEMLLAEDYKEKAQIIASRAAEIAALGVKVPDLEVELCSLPLDDNGTQVFTGRLKTIKAIAGGSSTRPAGAPAPFVGGSDAPSAAKPVMSF